MRRVLYKSCNTIILKCRNIKPGTPVFCFLKKNPVIGGSGSDDREQRADRLDRQPTDLHGKPRRRDLMICTIPVFLCVRMRNVACFISGLQNIVFAFWFSYGEYPVPVQPVHAPGRCNLGGHHPPNRDRISRRCQHRRSISDRQARKMSSSESSLRFLHFLFDAFSLSNASTTRVRKRDEKMKPETITVIRSILTADETLPKEEIDDILLNFRQKTNRRHLINAREAMSILRVSRPTLRSYVKQGLVEQIAFSPRRVRFDEDGIRLFAERGITSSSGSSRVAPDLIAH